MTDRLSLTLAALADPTRRAILARLQLGDLSIAELAQPFDIGVRAVSKHVSVLQRAGLVSKGRDAQRRPGHLELQPLREVDEWLEGYRQLWQTRMDNVAGVLARLQKGELE